MLYSQIWHQRFLVYLNIYTVSVTRSGFGRNQLFLYISFGKHLGKDELVLCYQGGGYQKLLKGGGVIL